MAPSSDPARAARLSSACAELSGLMERLETSRNRLIALAAELEQDGTDEPLSALYEAERHLRSAGRATRRAIQTMR